MNLRAFNQLLNSQKGFLSSKTYKLKLSAQKHPLVQTICRDANNKI